MRRHTVLIIALVFVFGCQDSSFEEKSINIGTHSLRCISSPKEGPVVIFDAGLTETFDTWIPIMNKLASQAAVFAYNRGGYEGSSMGALPRDSRREAAELFDLLRAANIKPPYILVGHSLGGLNMQIFAAEYKEKVKGIVLLDPPPLNWLLGNSFPELKKLALGQSEQFKIMAEDTLAKGGDAEIKKYNFFTALYSEHTEMFGKSARLADSIMTFGNLPVTVIASTVPNPRFGKDAEEYQQFWIDESRKLAAKSSAGKFIVAKDSRHHIHIDKQDLVVKEILEILNK